MRRRILGLEVEAHPVVFPVGAGLIVLFVTLSALWPRRALMLFTTLKDGIAAHFSWLYVVSMTGFLLFVLWLAWSRFGRLRLGKDDERPEFSRLSWFAMLFSAGMGIGMLFFGVAEPLFHAVSPPAGDPGTAEAARAALGITLFHWCLHPWALYAIVALGLAWFSFRRGLPLSFRSVLHPLLGDRIHGRVGDAVDILALLATLFGLATSLGLGAKQVNAGLALVFGLPQGTGVQVVLIACITLAAVVSLVSGLNAGIRRLSEINMGLAGILCLLVVVLGPTLYLLRSLPMNVAAYGQELVHRALWTGAGDAAGQRWLGGWTVFYWGWWIAWSPFVGMFIARISRGRTIREFVLGVLLVPSTVAVLWMTVFGGAAIFGEPSHDRDGARASWEVLVQDPTTGLPETEDGGLVAFDAPGSGSPTAIRVLAQDDGGLVSASRGAAVAYTRGVLIDETDGAPYRPAADEIFTGRFRSETRELTLGGYLTSPVLSASRSQQRDTTATALFVLLQTYPLGWLLVLIGTVSVMLFFVTSSDSASFVADMIASGGSPDPTLGTRLFWGILEGVLAATLLVAGGLTALQTGAIALGLPLALIIVAMCVSLVISLRRDG